MTQYNTLKLKWSNSQIKSLLIPLGLIAAASSTDASMHKKMFVSVVKN